MSAIYKLDERGFNRGVRKTLTMKPLVRAIKEASAKSATYAPKTATKRNVSVVDKKRK